MAAGIATVAWDSLARGLAMSAAAAIAGLAYGVSRTRRWRSAGWLAYLALLGVPFASLIEIDGLDEVRTAASLVWLVFPLLWAGHFFSNKRSLWATALLLAAVLLLPVLVSGVITFPMIYFPVGFLGAVSVVLRVMDRHRRWTEGQRASELAEANRALEALRTSLEQRIFERTSELARANAALQAEIAERQAAQRDASVRIGELALLNETSQALNRLAEPTEILNLIHTMIGRALDNRNVYIALYDEVDNFILFALYYIDGKRRPVAGRPFTNGLTEHVLRTRAPLLIADRMEARMAELNIDSIGRTARCYLGVPMLLGQKVAGVIAVQDYEREGAFGLDHQYLLSTVASQATIALENARLYSAMQRELMERARAEAAVREAETRYRTLVEEVPAAAYRDTPDELAASQYISPQIASLIGYAPEDFEADPRLRHKLIHPDDRAPALADRAGRLLVVGRSCIDYRMIARDGRLVWVRDDAMLVRNSDGSAAYVQGLLSDITELKQAEAALHSRTAELEQSYRALTESQEKLVISEKMASLGRLTAGIAHEVNTPLATVRTALAELLQLTAEYEDSAGDASVTAGDHREIAVEMRQAISLATKAAERAAGFVRGIKLQTRDMDPQEALVFNAVPIIRETLLLLSHALRRGNCTVNFAPAAEYVGLRGAPGRLGQVVTNLTTNAIDASLSRGGGPIDVDLAVSGQACVLVIRDEGCGIAPEHLPLIFEPMFTTKQFGEGTGLGLTIVHDIVTGHFGGAIDVASHPGAGTTVTVRLPLSYEAANDP